MNTRLACLAFALAMSSAAPTAFARDLVAAPGTAASYDDITTGSLGRAAEGAEARALGPNGWEGVSSAKAGNANQQERRVPQYGQTSGGPAY